MKKLLPLLLLTFLSFTCQKEVAHLQMHENQQEEDTMVKAHLFMRGHNLSGNYQTRHWETDLRPANDLSMHVLRTQIKNRYDTDLETLHGIVQEEIAKLAIDPLVYQPIHAAQLQKVALEVAHRVGLAAAPGARRTDLLRYYVAIIIAQRGVDCDAMAELITALEKELSPPQYREYRRYILKTAKQEQRAAEQKLQKLRLEAKALDGESPREAAIRADIIIYGDRLRSAEVAQRLLE